MAEQGRRGRKAGYLQNKEIPASAAQMLARGEGRVTLGGCLAELGAQLGSESYRR